MKLCIRLTITLVLLVRLNVWSYDDSDFYKLSDDDYSKNLQPNNILSNHFSDLYQEDNPLDSSQWVSEKDEGGDINDDRSGSDIRGGDGGRDGRRKEKKQNNLKGIEDRDDIDEFFVGKQDNQQNIADYNNVHNNLNKMQNNINYSNNIKNVQNNKKKKKNKNNNYDSSHDNGDGGQVEKLFGMEDMKLIGKSFHLLKGKNNLKSILNKWKKEFLGTSKKPKTQMSGDENKFSSLLSDFNHEDDAPQFKTQETITKTTTNTPTTTTTTTTAPTTTTTTTTTTLKPYRHERPQHRPRRPHHIPYHSHQKEDNYERHTSYHQPQYPTNHQDDYLSHQLLSSYHQEDYLDHRPHSSHHQENSDYYHRPHSSYHQEDSHYHRLHHHQEDYPNHRRPHHHSHHIKYKHRPIYDHQPRFNPRPYYKPNVYTKNQNHRYRSRPHHKRRRHSKRHHFKRRPLRQQSLPRQPFQYQKKDRLAVKRFDVSLPLCQTSYIKESRGMVCRVRELELCGCGGGTCIMVDRSREVYRCF